MNNIFEITVTDTFIKFGSMDGECGMHWERR
jgi:hypothetical protein